MACPKPLVASRITCICWSDFGRHTRWLMCFAKQNQFPPHGSMRMSELGYLRGRKDMAPSTVSPSQLENVRAYIQQQEEHHRTRTFQEEYLALLQRSRVEFDERYL
jgi:hypothetical protein